MFTPTLNRKEFCTAQAEAAMASATLLQIEADNGQPLLVLSRGAFTTQFNNVEQVRRVLAGFANDVEAVNV